MRLLAVLVVIRLFLVSPAAGQYLRGVNLAGAEFGMSRIPGVFNTDYTFNSAATYRYFAARNLNVIRLPLQWERLQPVLKGPLDAQYLGLLKTAIGWAAAAGNLVILDIHNFARYSFNEGGRLNAYVIDQSYSGSVRVSRADLADLWVRLSNEFSNEPTVYAYDLMNEPHDMAGWKEISQHVLSAIRSNGDNKLIMVPGDSWSSAFRWPTIHGARGWISDPANNFMYEAHQYFDSDESGTYSRSYDAELRMNPSLATVGSTRVRGFIDWCRNNNVRCYLGEFGVPNSDVRWLAVLDDFMKALDAAQISSAYWAAGDWWGNYPLSVQPESSYTVDRPQMPVLLAHLPPGTFTSLSAASNAGAVFAPGALMSGYGSELASATAAATSLPWPISLADASVELVDVTGAVFQAPLLFVSPGQINYQVPVEAALGRYSVVVKRNGTAISRGACFLERTAPTLFSAAAQILRLKADGARMYEYPAGQPIDFGDPSDRLFLTLYGTGFRNAEAPEGAALSAGNEPLALTYVGAQPETPGLDQINAELPRSLANAGQVALTFLIDGKRANPVTLRFGR